MSTILMRSECKKFAPNIFNKSKCTNCFRQKEEHSAEALECNRASRKVSKCGYLFVAPGWDFSNPLNRTKRWQRRWFVLYDDGELNYSVDEHPETVPQASIDMNKVVEVADAEEVTGNAYSLAIATPDRVHFVKGTCREEARWWADVLGVFPRSKGRHKRNATFPGSQTTSALLQQQPVTIRAGTPNGEPRPRFNSHSESTSTSSSTWRHVDSDTIPTRDVITTPTSNLPSSSPEPIPADNLRNDYRDQPASSGSPPTRDKIRSRRPGGSGASSDSSKQQQRAALLNCAADDLSRRALLEEYSDTRRDEKLKDIAASIVSPTRSSSTSSSTSSTLSPRRVSSTSSIIESNGLGASPGIASSSDLSNSNNCNVELTRRETPTRDRHRSAPPVVVAVIDKPERDMTSTKTSINSSTPRILPRTITTRTPSPAVDSTDQTDAGDKIRGDPDGCGLDLTSLCYSPGVELRVDLPSEALLNNKKGWLMKQHRDEEWRKHWFVLRGLALMFYRDPTGEDKDILEGVIALSGIRAISEIPVARNYGFQLLSWDGRRFVLSAVTAGIRSNWMSTLKKASGLEDPSPTSPLPSSTPTNATTTSGTSTSTTTPDMSPMGTSPPKPHLIGKQLEKELSTSQQRPELEENEVRPSITAPSINPVSATLPRSILFSSDEEYRTASEGGRRESGEWAEGLAPLPPSPPLNRTPISRVKEKARTRSTTRCRVYKKSKPLPPTGKRIAGAGSSGTPPANLCISSSPESTLTPIELPESDPDDLSLEMSPGKRTIVDNQAAEICELKRELSLTLRDYSMAENELLRLRQHQMDVTSLENQVKQLMSLLTNAERQLESRCQDMAAAEALQESHAKLVSENEGLLAERRAQEGWRTRCLDQQQQFAEEKTRFELQLNAHRERGEKAEALCHELNEAQLTIEQLRSEVISLSERLAMGIEENEALYARLRELELDSAAVQTEQRKDPKQKRTDSCASSNGSSTRSVVGSLSDLTNIDLDLDLQGLDKDRLVDECDVLRSRFSKAVQEIRAMRRELRDAHKAQDQLELVVIGQRQEAKLREDQEAAQKQLMVSRIDDLTQKLSAAEKQVRQLKHKLAKSESREKRRTLSLKGKESFQICKELEDKLAELETKINIIESGQILPLDKKVVETSNSPSGSHLARSSSRKSIKSRNGDKEKSNEENANSKMTSRLRRQSLDSATSSESMKVLIRMTSLENKVAKATKTLTASSKNSSSGIELSIQLDSILNNCQNMISSIKVHSNIDYPQLVQIEKCFSEISSILQKYQKQFIEKEPIVSSVNSLEHLLKEKLISLAEKRRSLRDAGILDREASMRILAEKLAFESVLTCRLRQAIDNSSLDGNTFCAISHSEECERLMDVLEAKLRGEKAATTCESSLDQFTHLITSKLLAQRHLTPSGNSSAIKERSGFEINPTLLSRQRELNKKVSEYCEERLNILAESLSQRSSQDVDHRNEEPLREAWRVAQQTVNSELIQAEISHVTWRCGQNYEAALRREVDLRTLCLSDSNRSLLQRWADATDIALRREMEEAAQKLSNRYHESVVDATDWTEEQSRASRRALEEFADIVAHRALINSRLQALCETATVKSVAPTTETPPPESTLAQFLGDEHLAAEFQYLYRHYEAESLASIPASNPSPSEILECLSEIHEHLSKAYSTLVNDDSTISPLPKCIGEPTWKIVQMQCSALGERMASLMVAAANYGSECQRCHQLQKAMDRLKAQHEMKLMELERNQQKEIERVKDDLDREKKSLTTKYELEQQQFRERTKLLERRLNSFDTEHSPMEPLHETYDRSIREQHSFDENSSGDSLISSSPNGDHIGGNVRARYQFEIQQLRELCEKGIITMENSHRRIIAELDEKHRQELSHLRLEKEQALAEETQATLAALDAMRKAHETEVQKEIAKFKSEFLQKMQATHDIGALHKEHEAEMEEIKLQILSLSQKYSDKCLESASLEDQLQLVNIQFNQAKQHIMQLESKNQQLRTQLRLEVNEMTRGEMIAEKDVTDTREEMDHHIQEPLAPSSHGVERRMLIPCLTNGGDQTHSYWEKSLLGTRRTGFEKPHQIWNHTTERSDKINRKNAHTASDIMKRPSEPLVKFLGPADFPTSGTKGMVAQRKKIFER